MSTELWIVAGIGVLLGAVVCYLGMVLAHYRETGRWIW